VHPVLAALRDRPEGARIALVVEGGGMRGAVSGGMVLALDELGLAQSFDAAYGSSAGTLNAMWLVSGRVREGIPTWTDPALVDELIDWRRVVGRRPVVDIETLVERARSALSSRCSSSGVRSAAGREPSPPAFDTAAARTCPCTPAIGA